MIKKFFMGIILLIYPLFVYPGDEVGNAGGLVENNIVLALSHIKPLISFCSDHWENCGINEKQKQALDSILEDIDHELENEKLVRFVSFRKYPNIFKDPTRIAVTGSRVADTIFFNKDLFYSIDPNGNVVPRINFNDALSILIHELGHHQGIVGRDSHMWLDQLGGKVSQFALSQLEERSVSPIRSNVFFKWVRFPRGISLFTYDLLSLADEELEFDISKSIRSFAQCPFPHHKKLAGVEFFQVGWRNILSPQPQIEVNLASYCLNESGDEFKTWVGDVVRILPQFNLLPENKINLKKKKPRYQYVPCHTNTRSCLQRLHLFVKQKENEKYNNQEEL